MAASQAAEGRRGFPVWELPLLAAIATAPFFGGGFDPLPGLWLSALVWASALLRSLTLRKAAGSSGWTPWLLATLPILAGISFLSSGNRGATVITTCLYASYACAGCLAAEVVRSGGAARLLGAMVVGAFAIAGDGLGEYVSWLKLGRHARILSRFENSNLLGGYLAAGLAALIGLAPLRSRLFGAVSWALCVATMAAVLAAGLVATGSRGALVSLAVGLMTALIVLILQRRLGSRPAQVFLFLALIATGIGGSLTMASYRERSGDRIATVAGPASEAQASALQASNRFRIITWKGAWAMGVSRPWLGWGAGSFETTYGVSARGAYTTHAHSAYLEVFAEQGVPGAVALVLLFVAAFLGLRRCDGGETAGWVAAAAGALAALAVHAAFEPLVRVPATSLSLWTLLGTGLAGWGRAETTPVRVGRLPRPARIGGACLAALGTLCLGVGLDQLARAQVEAPVRREAAEARVRTAGLLLPFSAPVAQLHAAILQSLDRTEAAVAEARRATVLTPYDSSSYVQLGNLLRESGQADEAVDAYRRALDCAPHEMDILCLYAAALEERGRKAEALEVYRRMIDLENSSEARLQPHNSRGPEYRFLRAHRAFIREARRSGNRAELLHHQERASEILASRRRVFDAEPTAYHVDFVEERRLRREECLLWRDLVIEYARSSRPDKLARARDNLRETEVSLSRLGRLTAQTHQHEHRDARAVSSN